MPLTFEDLNLERFGQEKSVAIALSGGPDSMALAWLLSRWSEQTQGPEIHALTVDHGLRNESAEEAQQVGGWIKSWPKMTHKILRWEGAKPDSCIMEEARHARYNLMADYCQTQNIGPLFMAHHQDDQAETFLIRLAAGSGLDGLSGMREVQPYNESMRLVRPLLNLDKEDLLSICRENDIPYIEDPSNLSKDYLRPRLRAAREVLEEEGLTSKRLARTARRLRRARGALEKIAQAAFGKILKEKDKNRLVFDLAGLRELPEEISLRIVLSAIAQIGCGQAYGPRMEKVEDLLAAIMKGETFKPRTLGGALFAIKDKNTSLYIEREYK